MRAGPAGGPEPPAAASLPGNTVVARVTPMPATNTPSVPAASADATRMDLFTCTPDSLRRPGSTARDGQFLAKP